MATTYVPYTAATVHDAYEGSFECQHCGLEAPALVSVKAHGRANGHGAYAAERALNSAGEDGSRLAARTLQFVACPACHEPQPGALGFRVGVILGALAIGAIIGAIIMLGMTGHLLPHRDTQQTPAVISYGIGSLFTIGLYWAWGRAWRGVNKRVQIDMSRAITRAPD